MKNGLQIQTERRLVRDLLESMHRPLADFDMRCHSTHLIYLNEHFSYDFLQA